MCPFAKEECFIVSPWAVKPVYASHHVDIPPNICHLSQKSVQAECFCSETWTSAQVTLPLTAPLFLSISLSLSQPPFLLSLITVRCIKRVDWGSHVLRARCGLTLRQTHTRTHTHARTHTHTVIKCFLRPGVCQASQPSFSLSGSACLHTPAFTSQGKEVYKHTQFPPFIYVLFVLSHRSYIRRTTDREMDTDGLIDTSIKKTPGWSCVERHTLYN